MNHELKIDDVYLQAKLAGDKLFEIRCNDRGFQKGDTVVYRIDADDPCNVRIIYFEITYVTGYMQQQNYVVFGERYIGSDYPFRDKEGK